jgi:hypothetical protein
LIRGEPAISGGKTCLCKFENRLNTHIKSPWFTF